MNLEYEPENSFDPARELSPFNDLSEQGDEMAEDR